MLVLASPTHVGKEPFTVIELEDLGISQVLWPVHCVQNSFGAEFHKDVDHRVGDVVVQKGQKRIYDSYSGFFDNYKDTDTGMNALLEAKGITDVF
jgi:nicotinamidase/pyrazinamidase